MISPGRVRWAYLTGAAVVAAVVVVLSVVALRYEAAAAESRRRAAHQARMRLALWRLESHVAPLLGRLSALSYAQYAPAYAPPALYTRDGKPAARTVLVEPSPVLLNDWPGYLRLHFQAPLQGRLTSPQVPEQDLKWVGRTAWVARPKDGPDRLATLRAWLPAPVRRRLARQAPPLLAAGREAQRWNIRSRASRAELAVRTQNYQQNSVLFTPRTNPEAEDNVWLNLQNDAPPPRGESARSGVRVRLSTLRAVWLPPRKGATPLLLYRVVEARGQRFLQGAWIDWDLLARELRDQVRDLFPRATLRRTSPEVARDETRMASLPVALVAPASAAETGWWTPARIALYLAWVLVLAVLLAGWGLVRRAVDLGTRRMSFVSAVSHELRTPLTAFRMYLDLLADDVVAEPERRREVLHKLRGQAERLGDLVGQVLDFARLERRSFQVRPTRVVLGDLVDGLVERSRERCDAAGVELDTVVEVEREDALQTDRATLEQVVLNLVDNACKYGVGDAPDEQSVTIDLTVRVKDGSLVIRVRDPGPGVPQREVQRIFEPFYRAGDEMTRSQTGVGLGLALSRRFVAGLGGELELTGASRDDGTYEAEFTVRIPFGTP